MFEILQIKYTTKTTIYSIDLSIIIYFYTDVSGFETELTIIQFRKEDSENLSIKIFVLYNLFIFLSIQKLYSIYKKKLYLIVKFAKQYNYLCKHFYNQIVIYTNY